ncbi:hypothetical protein HDN1F_02700 [gamma proteobacterium HdN1]|nr:hypothetical protein HDN1F_02700 [gamma proteobacterium HdN1]
MPSAPLLGKRAILVRAVQMLLSFVSSPAGVRARLMFTVLVLLLVSTNGFNVLISYASRDFMTAIEQKHVSEFLHQALLMTGLFVASTVAASFARFFEERLGLLWRKALTERTLHQYMSAGTFYFIEAKHSEQRPDQRISEDIRALTSTALSFLLMMLNSLLGIIAFAGVLLDISPLLLLVSFLYAATGSLIALWLGNPLIALNSRQVDREADFRSELLNVRTHAERIALLQRETILHKRLLERLDALVANTKRMIAVNLRLAFFTGSYSYMIQIIPALVVAPLFMEDQADFGVIAQSALAFTVLVNAFSLIVSQFPSISSFAAVVTRLHALNQVSDEAQKQQANALEVLSAADCIRYENVSLFPIGDDDDEKSPLLRDFNIEIRAGQRTLIHSTHKVLLLRLFNATAGTEKQSEGKLWLPTQSQVFFLPEKPWIPPGTLRDALDATRHGRSDGEIAQVLAQLGIAQVVESVGGLDSPQTDWNASLSIGEQKLLDIGRLLLARPRFAFLFRLHSVLSHSCIDELMPILYRSGITYIHLGRYEYPECYEQIIELCNDGSWKIQPQDDA